MTPPAAREVSQVSRWRLKHHVAQLLRAHPGEDERTPAVCKCGAARHDAESVTLTRAGGRPGVLGVFFCDSPWLCPSCAPRRAAERAERVGRVFDATETMGGAVAFVTLTVQHRHGQGLADLKALVSGACRRARQGAPWARAAEKWGVHGVIVGPEVTWSPFHGWHFHLHLAVPMRATGEDAAEAGEWLAERYRSYIAQAGGRADRRAQDVQVVWRREDLESYIAKGSAHWEVASAGATKVGSGGGLTPWDLAARASRGDKRAAALFLEYARTMPGTRSCVISRALAGKLGLEVEEDEDRPGEEPEAEAETLGDVEAGRWHRLLRHGHVPIVFAVIASGAGWPEIEARIDGLIGKVLSLGPRAPEPPPPKHWTPTAADIRSARRSFVGSTARQAGEILADLHRTAADKGLPLKVDSRAIIAAVV